jgi:hypothetical protein
MSQAFAPSQMTDPFAIQMKQLRRCFARMPAGDNPHADDVSAWGEEFAQCLVRLNYRFCHFR